jgi:peptidoglycan/LPS O-acetylase OafA/YrhL
MSPFDLRHPNALAFARLILAVLVIVSHSPELIDGNPDREFLKRCFGTLTTGQVAVHGFFFISGFLIVDSAVRRAPLDFLAKRVLRIVPGFVVAFLVSITLVFWLGGGEFTELSAEKWAAKISKVALLLNPAQVGSAFAGTPAPDVNGSLWTIAYEFRCYLLALAVVLVFGRSGLPFLLLAAALSLTLLFSLSTGARWQFDTGNYEPIGNVDDAVRFTLAFASGAAFQLFKHRIPRNGTLALTCVALLAIGMLWAETASIAVSIFGGYLLLYLAFAASGSFWSDLNRKNDISYGIYLYAWPIQKLGILYLPAIAPIQLTAVTIPLAAGAGLMSWHLVEKHALRWRLPDRFSPGKGRSREDEIGAAPVEIPATPQPARVRGRRYA